MVPSYCLDFNGSLVLSFVVVVVDLFVFVFFSVGILVFVSGTSVAFSNIWVLLVTGL